MKKIKKILPALFLIFSMGTGLVVHANTQDTKLKEVETYLEGTKNYTHHIFSLNNSVGSDLSKGENAAFFSELDEGYLSELDIVDYSLNDMEKVYEVNNEILMNLDFDESDTPFLEESYLLYVPAMNADKKKVAVVFSDGTKSEVKSLIISNNNQDIYMNRSEVKKEIQSQLANEIDTITYFLFPTPNTYVITAYIEMSDGNKYMMPTDSISDKCGLEKGHLYSLEELAKYYQP